MISSVQASSSLQVPQQSMLLAAQGRKPGSLPKPGMPAGLGHIRETLPMPFILQAPEEQTDNWDDDFEEGISLSERLFTRVRNRTNGEYPPFARACGSI